MAKSVLGEVNFRRLWIGQTVSQFGDALYGLIFLFMVATLTDRTDMVGFVGAIQALPFLVLSPIAGVVADRLDRRSVMLFSDLASTAILLCFAALVLYDHSPPLWIIFATAGLLSCVNVFFLPAKSAAIPRLVSEDKLMEANSLSQASQSLMPMIGLAISATVIGALSSAQGSTFFVTAVIMNALSFLISAFYIVGLPRIKPKRTSELAHPLEDAKAGLRFIAKNRLLKVVLALSVSINLLIAPFMVVYIESNKRWFGGEFSTLAWFEFSFMAGMLLGSILVGRVKITRPGISYVIGIAICGIGIAFLAWSRTVFLFVVLNAICGIALPFASIPLSTTVQLLVPDEFRGRVNSALTMVTMAAPPLGMGLAGILTEKIGLVNMYLLIGFGMVFIALLGLLDSGVRGLRNTRVGLKS